MQHRLTPFYFSHRSQQKITIVGAHLEPETPEEEPLVLGVFKPKDGIREKLRETLHTVLMEEMAERSQDSADSEGPSTDAPVNTVTISKNTRYWCTLYSTVQYSTVLVLVLVPPSHCTLGPVTIINYWLK